MDAEIELLGFKQRARERAAQDAVSMTALNAGLHTKLNAEIAAVLAALLAEPGANGADIERYTKKAAGLQRGVDAVLVRGIKFAFEDHWEEQDDRAGAMLAHAARNVAFISGTLENANTTRDIRYFISGHR